MSHEVENAAYLCIIKHRSLWEDYLVVYLRPANVLSNDKQSNTQNLGIVFWDLPFEFKSYNCTYQVIVIFYLRAWKPISIKLILIYVHRRAILL